MLTTTLRKDWKFQGYIVSDCGAVEDIVAGHKFAPDIEHASVAAVRAGTDNTCGQEFVTLVQAVKDGLIKESEIDTSLQRLFTARFRLGMFDPAADVPFNSILFSENDSAANAVLSLQAARASIVLLKNNRNTLPLTDAARTIAVVGPNADALAALEGNYNGTASHPVTPLAALESRLPGHILYAQGSAYADGIPLPVPSTVFSTTANGAGQRGLKAEYFNGPVLNFLKQNIP